MLARAKALSGSFALDGRPAKTSELCRLTCDHLQQRWRYEVQAYRHERPGATID